MKKQRLNELFARYMQQSSTDQEESELMLLLVDPELRMERDHLLEEWMDKIPVEEGMSRETADKILRNIKETETQTGKLRTMRPAYRLWWAAAAVLILGLGAYITVRNPKDRISGEQTVNITHYPPPGTYRATLKLGNGSLITLDSAAKGLIAKLGSTDVNKINSGEVAYNALNEKPTVEYNTLSTPMGGLYKLVLPDGSKVWLNAASSIYFPTAFTGNQRAVSITGEVYFEVTHHPDQPFIVSVPSTANQQPSTITVLGTHFNINSYTDESSQTITLLEGSVNISNVLSQMKLVPGQQADITSDEKMVLRKEVDTEGIVAWKNGDFNFVQADIQTIMRQISRWYNVQVVYEGKISKKKFDGILSRNSSLEDVLKIMEAAGIKFKIEGKKITVKS